MADLSSIANLKQYLGIEGSTNDDALGRILTAVSAEIESWCGQPIVRATDNVSYSFRGWGYGNTGIHALPYFPVYAVGSLTRDMGLGEAAETIDTGDYDLVLVNSVYGVRSSMASGYAYTLLLTVGYELVPADVEQVCLEMCAVRVRDSGISDSAGSAPGKSTLGLQSRSESAGGTVTKSTVYNTPNWQERLAPYRVVTL